MRRSAGTLCAFVLVGRSRRVNPRRRAPVEALYAVLKRRAGRHAHRVVDTAGIASGSGSRSAPGALGAVSPDRRRRHVGVLPPRPLPQRRRVRLPRWHLPDTGQQRTHRGPPPQPRRRSRPQPRHPHHRHGQNARLPRYPGLHRPPHRRRQTIREIKRCLKRCDRSGHPLRGRAHGRCSAGPGADLGGRSRTGGSAYDDARCWLAPPVLLRRRGGPPYQSRHRTVASSRRLPLVVRMTAAPRA